MTRWFGEIRSATFILKLPYQSHLKNHFELAPLIPDPFDKLIEFLNRVLLERKVERSPFPLFFAPCLEVTFLLTNLFFFVIFLCGGQFFVPCRVQLGSVVFPPVEYESGIWKNFFEPVEII